MSSHTDRAAVPGHKPAGKPDGHVRLLFMEKQPVIRLVVLATVLACSLLTGFATWFIWSTRQTQIQQTEVATSNVARMVGAQVESAMKTATMALADIAERAAHDTADPEGRERLNDHLAEVARITPELHGLFVFGADGAWLATSLGRDAQGNHFDLACFQHHRTRPGADVHVGAPLKSRSTGVWIIPISRGIYNADGTFAGVVLATLRINFFERIYDELNIGRSGTVLLMLADGTVVYRRPFDEALIGTDLSEGNIYKRLQAARFGSAFLRAKVDQIERLYSFRHLDRAPFLVAVGRTKEELLRDWRRASILIGGAALLISAVFIGFATKLVAQVRIRDALDQQLRLYSADLERHNLGLRTLAHTDKLTQLANRRRFDDVLEQELKRAQRNRTPVSLLMMDLDYFKQFNDTYGHPAGDECLRATARVLSERINRAGDLAARYGGEEFAVIMPCTDEAGAVAVAERVRAGIAALRIPHQQAPERIVSASFGVATVTPDSPAALAAAELLDRADRCLYDAKKRGRNRVCTGSRAGATLE